ncbi:lysis protein [Pseudomonas aeruginosa]|uniref:lysis protein n=1 Tax=Pseudomonas aeruginosa TaxID=287 RepID=UPI000F7949E6|nr:lysis protein [Pseudomonas aeruginosa]RRX92827.1 lysis protein [Pseudomonas aeruginosa]
MGILSLLRSNWFWVALVAVLYSVAVVIHGSASYDRGYATARAEGDAALLNLQLQHSNELAKIAEDNLLQFQQQVTRANQAEARFLSVQDQFTALQQQLSERIAHVSTQYRPAPGASPVPAPRFVVTCGWLRDYNHALGADLPSPAACRTAASPQETAWPASGADAELLESGVSAADILAHARDYGKWSLTNLAQLNALLDVNDKETH